MVKNKKYRKDEHKVIASGDQEHVDAITRRFHRDNK